MGRLSSADTLLLMALFAAMPDRGNRFAYDVVVVELVDFVGLSLVLFEVAKRLVVLELGILVGELVASAEDDEIDVGAIITLDLFRLTSYRGSSMSGIGVSGSGLEALELSSSATTASLLPI